MAAIALFGVVSYRALPVADLPTVDFPTLQVSDIEWAACGVTPQAVIAAAKLPFAITHAPGLMLVTDLRNKHLAVL